MLGGARPKVEGLRASGAAEEKRPGRQSPLTAPKPGTNVQGKGGFPYSGAE